MMYVRLRASICGVSSSVVVVGFLKVSLSLFGRS